MQFRRRIDSKDFMLLKQSFQSFTVVSPSYFHPVWCLSLLLAVCLLQCLQVTADGQHNVAASNSVASMMCPRPFLKDLMLLWNNDSDTHHNNFMHDGDEELTNENVADPSRVMELNETTLEQAFALQRGSNGTFMIVLFYADWCPFSKELRPTYLALSSLFPSVYHVAVEGTTLRPSVLSKYGVHSFPLLFLYNKTSRERYYGSRELKDLIIFLKNGTGLEPLALGKSAPIQISVLPQFVKDTNESKEYCPFPQSLSSGNWLRDDTYLILATWFLVLRVLLPVLPWVYCKLKRFWNRCHLHLFAALKFCNLFKEKIGHGTFAIDIAELESQHFTQRWRKSLFS